MMPMQKFRSLHQTVDQIFDAGKHMSIAKLAKKSGLSYMTVWKLANYETMYPRSQTIMMLARAVGYDFQLVKRE